MREQTLWVPIYGMHLFYFVIFLIKFFYLFFLAMSLGMRDLSSPARDQTHAPCSGSSEP